MRVCVCAGVVALVVLGIGAVASAQTIGGGVKGGIVSSTVSGDIGTGQEKNTQTGGTFGGFLTAWFNDMWAFQPEVNYVMGGVKSTFTVGSQKVEIKNHIDMTDIALLLRAGSKPSRNVGGYFLVGPDFGIINRAKATVEGQPEEDFKDELKSASVGLTVAGGVTVGHFLVEGRYMAGLSDLNKTAQSSGTNKIRAFSIMAGVEW
jgi:hypothetical protein